MRTKDSRKRIAAVWGALGLFACAGGPASMPLAARGLPPAARYAYADGSGYPLENRVRDAFLSGCVVKGMPREFVARIYGSPDRNSASGDGWEYLDDHGNLVTGILFAREQVDSLYGDPAGGAPPGGPCR